MPIRQIKQHSGSVFHLNLDQLACERAKEIMAHCAEQDTPVSLSVVVRRAIRAYAEHVGGQATEEERLKNWRRRGGGCDGNTPKNRRQQTPLHRLPESVVRRTA